MKRNILRWCINWWSDTSRPQWLRSAMQKDSTLLQYDLELKQMAEHLRADAPSWAIDDCSDDSSDEPVTDAGNFARSKSARQKVPNPSSQQRGVQPSSLARRQVIAIAATAATIAVAVCAWQFQGYFLNTSSPNVAAKHKSLAAAESEFNALLTVMNETKSRVTDKVSFLPTLMDDTTPTAANIHSLRQATRSSFESLARGYGQALSVIHQSARQQVIGDDSALRQIMRGVD